MTTESQSTSARKQVNKRRKAQRSRIRFESRSRSRAKPGATGGGEFYHIEVRPKTDFHTFRTQDVGKKGGIERVAGQRTSGSWDTQKWLVAKKLAHAENGRLIADTSAAQDVLEQLGSKPVHIVGDRFKARPKPNVPEAAKPTPAQRRSQQRNIKKAQAARVPETQ